MILAPGKIHTEVLTICKRTICRPAPGLIPFVPRLPCFCTQQSAPVLHPTPLSLTTQQICLTTRCYPTSSFHRRLESRHCQETTSHLLERHRSPVFPPPLSRPATDEEGAVRALSLLSSGIFLSSSTICSSSKSFQDKGGQVDSYNLKMLII